MIICFCNIFSFMKIYLHNFPIYVPIIKKSYYNNIYYITFIKYWKQVDSDIFNNIITINKYYLVTSYQFLLQHLSGIF